MADDEKTTVSARVDTKTYDRFVELVPQFGGTTWFIATALEQFVSQYEGQPAALEQVRKAVSLHNLNK